MTNDQSTVPSSLPPIESIVFRILADSSLTYGERGAVAWIAVRNHIDPGFDVSAMDMATTLGMSLPKAKQTLRRATHLGYTTTKAEGRSNLQTRYSPTSLLSGDLP